MLKTVWELQGVSSKQAICSTCGQKLQDCTGHFGKAKLPASPSLVPSADLSTGTLSQRLIHEPQGHRSREQDVEAIIETDQDDKAL